MKQEKRQIFERMPPVLDSYPTVSTLCREGRDHQLTLPAVPGLKLDVPAACIKDDITITLTVYYADPPYNTAIPIQQDDDHVFIQLSPIVRLEPDGYQFVSNRNSQASLQLPICRIHPSTSQPMVNDDLDTAIKLCYRRSDGSQEWQIENLQYKLCADENGSYCIRFSISHFSDNVIMYCLKTIFAPVNMCCFPSLQQRIKTLAFLSEVDKIYKTVYLKFVLASIDEDEEIITDVTDNGFIEERLETTGLENTILKNGEYTAKLKGAALRCKESNISRRIVIDWNQRLRYSLTYTCQIKNSNKLEIAEIDLKPKYQHDNDYEIHNIKIKKRLSQQPQIDRDFLELPDEVMNQEISNSQAHQALDNYREEFMAVIPVDDLLSALESQKILSDRQKITIRNYPYQVDGREALFDILRKERTVDDFLKFCKLLLEHEVTTVQKLGNKLLRSVKS